MIRSFGKKSLCACPIKFHDKKDGKSIHIVQIEGIGNFHKMRIPIETHHGPVIKIIATVGNKNRLMGSVLLNGIITALTKIRPRVHRIIIVKAGR